MALAVLFLLAYIVPTMLRQRRIYADAPIEERYAEDLRLITGRTLSAPPNNERGTIFTTERKMTTSKPKAASQAVKLRAVARDRSRARARISQRKAFQARGILLGGAIAALTVIFWIAAGFTGFPAAVAIASTVLGGAYLVGFGYVVTEWNRADDEDRERIARADRVLDSRGKKVRASFDRVSAKTAAGEATADTSAARSSAAKVTAEKPLDSDHAVAKDATEIAPAIAPTTAADEETSGSVVVEKAEKASEASIGTKPKTQARPITPRVAAPAYTLKPTIQKRTVKPYVAPEPDEADVPFRPTQVGQRLGDAELELPNAASQMSGEEELRSDLLGGGSTLDALLDRRRA